MGQIESFVAAPAKDSVPFRRDELPGFMQSLSERYEYEAWDCHSGRLQRVGGPPGWC